LLYSPTGVPDVDAVTAGRQGFDVIWHTRQYEDDPTPTLFYRNHLDLRGTPVGKPVRLGGAGRSGATDSWPAGRCRPSMASRPGASRPQASGRDRN
jgi:hypothetical protein